MEVEFGDQISFLKAQNNLPEVVIATECLTSTTSYFFDSTHVVNKAPRILQEEMSAKFKEFPQPKWPPTAEELRSERFEPPAKLLSFIETLLTATTGRASRSKKTTRLARSISQDIVFIYCQGKVLQPKHLLLGLGLHNLTGSHKLSILLTNFDTVLITIPYVVLKPRKQSLSKKKLLRAASCPYNQKIINQFTHIFGSIILTSKLISRLVADL